MKEAKMFRFLERLIAACLAFSLGIALMMIVACVCFQVVMRYVFGAPPSWSEELALLMFSWLTIGGLAFGLREGIHVAIDVGGFLSAPLRKLHGALVAVLAVGFGIYLAWSGWRFVDFMWGSKSAAIRYPLEILNIMPVVSGSLIAVFGTAQLFGIGKQAVPAPKANEEISA